MHCPDCGRHVYESRDEPTYCHTCGWYGARETRRADGRVMTVSEALDYRPPPDVIAAVRDLGRPQVMGRMTYHVCVGGELHDVWPGVQVDLAHRVIVSDGSDEADAAAGHLLRLHSGGLPWTLRTLQDMIGKLSVRDALVEVRSAERRG